jgi:hypothetical protein
MHLIPVPSHALQFYYALTSKPLNLVGSIRGRTRIPPSFFFFVFPCLFSGLLALSGRGLLLLLGRSVRLSSGLSLR